MAKGPIQGYSGGSPERDFGVPSKRNWGKTLRNVARTGALVVAALEFSTGKPVANPNSQPLKREGSPQTSGQAYRGGADLNLHGVSGDIPQGGKVTRASSVSADNSSAGSYRGDDSGAKLTAYHGDSIGNGTVFNRVVSTRGKDGPDNEVIYKARQESNPRSWGETSNPAVLAKSSLPHDAGLNLPPFGEPSEFIRSFVDQTVEFVAATFLGDGPPACAGRLPDAKNTVTSPTPTIVRDAKYSDASLAAKLISDNSFKDDLAKYDQFTVNIKRLITTQFGTEANNIVVQVPLNDRFLNGLRANLTPNTFIYNKATGDVYMVAFGGQDARLVKMPSNGIWTETEDSNHVLQNTVVIPLAKTENGDIISKAIFSPNLGLIYDVSNVPATTPELVVLQKQAEAALIKFAKDIHKQDDPVHPQALVTELLSIDRNGKPVIEVKVTRPGQNSEYVFYNPNTGEFVRPDPGPGKRFSDEVGKNGELKVQVAGRRTNTDEWYDTDVIFDPTANGGTGAFSDTSKTPTPPPTATEVRPTRAPTATPTMTEIPRVAKFEWGTDFENGLSGFTYDAVRRVDANSYFDIIDDPTGSGRGKVYRGIVNGSPPNLPQNNNGTHHRPYPDIYFPYKEGPYSAEVDVYIFKDIQYSRLSDGHIVSVLSAFNGSPIDYKNYSVQVQVNLRVVGGRRMLTLMVPGDTETAPQVAIPYEPDAPEFSYDKWQAVKVDVDKNGKVKLFQDGKVISIGELPEWSKARIGISGGHAGLYGRNNLRKAILLNDRFKYTSY